MDERRQKRRSRNDDRYPNTSHRFVRLPLSAVIFIDDTAHLVDFTLCSLTVSCSHFICALDPQQSFHTRRIEHDFVDLFIYRFHSQINIYLFLRLSSPIVIVTSILLFSRALFSLTIVGSLNYVITLLLIIFVAVSTDLSSSTSRATSSLPLHIVVKTSASPISKSSV